MGNPIYKITINNVIRKVKHINAPFSDLSWKTEIVGSRIILNKNKNIEILNNAKSALLDFHRVLTKGNSIRDNREVT